MQEKRAAEAAVAVTVAGAKTVVTKGEAGAKTVVTKKGEAGAKAKEATTMASVAAAVAAAAF